MVAKHSRTTHAKYMHLRKDHATVCMARGRTQHINHLRATLANLQLGGVEAAKARLLRYNSDPLCEQ